MDEQRRMEISGMPWPGRENSIEGKLESEIDYSDRSKINNFLEKEIDRNMEGFLLGALTGVSVAVADWIVGGVVDKHYVFEDNFPEIVASLGYFVSASKMFYDFDKNKSSVKNASKKIANNLVSYSYGLATSLFTPSAGLLSGIILADSLGDVFLR